MKVVIGCPVRSREWIMRRWFFHTSMAAEFAGVDVEYVFVVAADDPSREVIAASAPGPYRFVDSQEVTAPDLRGWNPTRFRHMTILRNWLLNAVRETDPDYFLSLDSDILLHEDALHNLIDTAGSGYDAVGGKCWMTDLKDACSYLMLINSHGFVRPDVHNVIPVDVIMAIKLMSRKAYAIDYIFDSDGEDVGWSREATRVGLKLGFDGRVCSKHVMREFDVDGTSRLNAIDPRCGY
ncbi:MAG: glycosyltransferase family 2 protein [Solirubrobacteraceae bacterium]